MSGSTYYSTSVIPAVTWQDH